MLQILATAVHMHLILTTVIRMQLILATIAAKTRTVGRRAQGSRTGQSSRHTIHKFRS